MWKEKYKIGVPLIDRQHEELFDRVSSFIYTIRKKSAWELKKEQIIETMNFMQEYVIVHFNSEEAFQEQINYPNIETHKLEHEQFKQKVNDYVERIIEEDYDEKLVQEFAGRLMTWLILHVTSSDQKIADYVEEPGGRLHE